MSIGRKIKELRTAKCITQSHLAGEYITRNMLSRIENGAALPSLTTVIYIAEKLNVPVGYLLEDGERQLIYKKINNIDNIKRALSDHNYRICCDLCRSVGFVDDELSLIMAKCNIGIAKEELICGKLRSAASFIQEAIEYNQSCLYYDITVEAISDVFLRYIKKFSPTLAIDITEMAESRCIIGYDTLCDYILAIDEMEHMSDTDIEKISSKYRIDMKSSYFAHIESKYYMRINSYVRAFDGLNRILNSQERIPDPMLYDVFKDLEFCSKKLEDYKGAYEYSVNKVNILDRMLSENDI